MFNLGLAYVNGTGVAPDPARGVAWLEICRKEHNHRKAIRALVARRQLTPEQLQAVPELEKELAASLPK
jgi:TPR repeat protein